jgi:hypothetical protein
MPGGFLILSEKSLLTWTWDNSKKEYWFRLGSDETVWREHLYKALKKEMPSNLPSGVIDEAVKDMDVLSYVVDYFMNEKYLLDTK